MTDIDKLHEKIDAIAAAVVELQMRLDDISAVTVVKNKDGIPVGTKVEAEIEDKLVILDTEKNGYRVDSVGGTKIVNGVKYTSLSAAAEALSKIKRKSGWIFWHDSATGKTLKEQYKG